MKRKLKICSPQLGLNPNSDLGGEVHDHNILQGLAQKGHKIFVYLPKDRLYQKHKNIFVERAPFKHIPAFTFNFIALPYIFRTYSKEKFDILRIHTPYFLGIAAFIFKIFHPYVPIVATYHLKEKGLFFDLINRIFVKNYSKSIAVSKFLKNWLVKRYGLKDKNVDVVYNGVDKDFRPQKKNRVLIKKYDLKEKIVLLYMGLLIERKNPIFLLRVFQILKNKYPNIALLICGRGPLEEKMKTIIKQRKIKDVVFAGKVEEKNKVDHYNLCDIFVLPSISEGFGLVIAEAMACAKPVIITKGWSAKEAVDDKEEGLLAKENDLSDWEKKIEILIKDGNKRRLMGEKARQKTIQKFSWEKSVKGYEDIFLKFLTHVF